MSVQLRTLPKTLWATVAAGLLAALVMRLWVGDSEVMFLPGSGQADWIVFPYAPEINPHPMVNLDAIFRRELTLDQEPREGRLSVRAARHFELRINGSAVDAGTNARWKEFSAVNVLPELRPGTNRIEVRVSNYDGPPALCLALKTDQGTLRTDGHWEVSYAGSAWRHAALARESRVPGKGNVVAGSERTLAAVATVWPLWLVFAAAAAVIWWAGNRWLSLTRSQNPVAPGDLSARRSIGLLTVVAAAWVVLFIHNAKLIPAGIGFDATSHSEYIRYVQQHRALPFANEGFEMFQPPLYYGISALGLSVCGLSIADGGPFLHLLSMIFGIAHFTLVFLILRLVFPGRIGPPLIGLLLAAFTPMQIYLCHYITNETLAATLASAMIYLCLRLLKAQAASTAQYAGLGICMGAAMLSKVTDILLVPFVVAVLVWKLIQQRPSAEMWLRTFLTLAVCFVVGDWYYILVWIRFGTPFVGNWEALSGFAWWQDHGYRTWADYTRFGRSLMEPLFSSFAGFADGIYSTFWGDALCGGTVDLLYRPPWNYSLMAAGYLLALAPSLMLACGAVVAFGRFLRRPSSDQFLLLGFFAVVVFGLIWVSLTVASYAQAKSFYGLCALAVLCFFGALGWEVLTRGRKRLQFALGMVLLVWAMNSFASYWIRQDSEATRTFLGLWHSAEGKTNAALSELTLAVDVAPANARAQRCLAIVLDKFGRTTEALPHARRAAELSPSDPACHLLLGKLLADLGQPEQALTEGRRAVELGPEHTAAYRSLAMWLLDSGRTVDAIAVARAGLAVAPSDPFLHYAFGLAASQQGALTAAATQLTYASSIRPGWAGVHLQLGLVLLGLGQASNGLSELKQAAQLEPETPAVLKELAWVLATNPDAALRDGQEAVRLAEHACAVAKRKDAGLLSTLAAAYAEVGRFADAMDTVHKAIALAQSPPADEKLLVLDQELLKCFQSGRPYRQNPPPLR